VSNESLYARLGGYDAIAAVTNDVYPRMQSDDKMRRFWDGGPLLYTGRDMVPVHKGMGIDEEDWERFIGYLTETLGVFNVPEQERNEVLAFVESTKQEIVE